MIRRIASLAGIASIAALALAAPASAAPPSNPAAPGTEHFQLLATSPTSNTATVITYGVVNGAAVDNMGSKVDTFVFPNGFFKVRHVTGKGGSQKFNAKTCLAAISQRGTYKIVDGTGKYVGISGHGTFRLSILVIAARNSHGACSRTLPPLAFELVLKASGPMRK
jgi:hypothetical protein